MRYFRYFFILLLVLLGISFACLNAETVNINYYLGDRTFYLPFLLAIVLLIGALLGFIVCLPTLIRLRHDNRKLRKQIQFMQEEVSNLRTIPILNES